MEGYKILALDESGKASYKHLSKNFVLSGLILSEGYKMELDNQVRQLKLKYFNDENIVFHCRDMLRKKGSFAVWRQNQQLEVNFWSEFIEFFNNDNLSIALVITNKEKAKNIGWNEITILRRAYSKILEEFTNIYLQNNKGKIIAESDPYQDKYLIEAHNRLQSIGIPSQGISSFDYRHKITSLSLVNKLNYDVDIQLADSLAIMANLVYNRKINNLKKLTDIESMMIDLIDSKMKDANNKGILEILA